MSAFIERIQPLRDLMKAKGLDAFVLRRNPNLAWAIAGRAHVPTTIDMACFDLIITQDSATAITNVVEAPRLVAEELPAEVKVQTVKWSEGRDHCFQPDQRLVVINQVLTELILVLKSK